MHTFLTASDRWFSRTAIGALTAALLVVSVSCGGDSTDNESNGAGSVNGGAELYQSSCASCHGVDLSGTDRGPSHLSVVYEPDHHGDDAFRSAIRNGARQHHWNFGDMAPVAGLTDDEVEQIIAYVRSEQIRQGFEP